MGSLGVAQPFGLIWVLALVVLLLLGLTGVARSAELPLDYPPTTSAQGSPSGSWTVVAPTGREAGQVLSPAGIALDSQGNLFVTDREYNRVEQREPSGGWSLTATGWDPDTGLWPGAPMPPKPIPAGRVWTPWGVTVDSAGNLYLAEAADWELSRIQMRDGQGHWSVLATFGEEPGQVVYPTSVVVDGAGNLYVADWGTSRVQVRSREGNWSVLASLGTEVGLVREPKALALDREGNLYVADTSNYRIQKRTPAGDWSVVASWESEPVDHYQPWGLAVDAAGGLYVSLVAPNAKSVLRRLDPSGAVTDVATQGTGLGQVRFPQGLAIGTDGSLYVADWGNQRVQKLMATSRAFADVDGNGSVGLEDALLVLRYCLDLSSLTPDEIQAADANGDGVVSIADV
ncbi:MAG TPA: dockerin type I domain-containing protein, partial [Armatimonadota bacterium]